MASQRHSREDHKVIGHRNVIQHHNVTISAKISNVIPVSTATSFPQKAPEVSIQEQMPELFSPFS